MTFSTPYKCVGMVVGVQKVMGFYLLDKYGKPFIEKTSFQSNSVLITMRPAFYLGGFNASTKHRQGVVKSKLFRGIISNMEIIHTRSTSIPEELLELSLE